MESPRRFARPTTLEERSHYFLRERQANGVKGLPQWVYTSVQLAAYDPCPACVIVQAEFGRRRRCLREDLFCTVPAPDFIDSESSQR